MGSQWPGRDPELRSPTEFPGNRPPGPSPLHPEVCISRKPESAARQPPGVGFQPRFWCGSWVLQLQEQMPAPTFVYDSYISDAFGMFSDVKVWGMNPILSCPYGYTVIYSSILFFFFSNSTSSFQLPKMLFLSHTAYICSWSIPGFSILFHWSIYSWTSSFTVEGLHLLRFNSVREKQQ